MPNLNALNFTPEQLDDLAVITDIDIAIAAGLLAHLLSPQYRNLLLALPADVKATNQTEGAGNNGQQNR